MFKLIKEIKSKEGVLHFRRWNILSMSNRFINFSIYLHGIYKEDQDEHLHNHPWNIATIILWGSYIEELYIDDFLVNTKTDIKYLNTRGWLNFGYRPRKHYHKIQKLLSKKVFTLALVWGKKSDWGYNVNGKEVNHLEYRKKKNFNL